MVTSEGQKYPVNASVAIPAAVGTLWESWTGTGSTSLNHAMFAGGPALWMAEEVLGLKERVRFRCHGPLSKAALWSPLDRERVTRMLGLSGDPPLSSLLSHDSDLLWSSYGIGPSQARRAMDINQRFSGDLRLRHLQTAISMVQSLSVGVPVGDSVQTSEECMFAPLLQRTLHFTLDEMVARSVLEARGSLQTFAGPVSVHWKLGPAESIVDLALCALDGGSVLLPLAEAVAGPYVVHLQSC